MNQSTTKEIEILFLLIQTRYGDRVTAEELEEIRKGLSAIFENATAIRSIELENSDEPHQYFRPDGEL